MTFRLFWFIVGAGTATWWMKHHEVPQPQYQVTYPDSQKRDKSRECAANQPSVTLTECQRWGWGHRWGHNKTQAEWDEDRAKMVALSRQATDTMGEVSEAALDTLLTTVTALKSKLAEVRAQREQEQKRMEEQRKQQPARWL